MADPPREAASGRIVRRKLSDQVLERLNAMIASGEIAPGTMLPSERQLMDRFGVGRPAVREALQSLHNNGLITISHGERSRVNEIDAATVLNRAHGIAKLVLDRAPANLEHLKHARRMFELGMVRLAAREATAGDVTDLRSLIETQRDRLGAPLEFIDSDMGFHTRIASISRNPIMVAVSEAMLKWLFDYHRNLLFWSGHEDVTLTEHARIVDRIADRDEEGAVQEMSRHLDRSAAAFEPRG
ncbi:transcriptional regulator NanR [Sulfitobacter sp. LCG007]